MPRTKVQKLFFIFLTVLISVIAFAIYNVAISMGSMSNRVFLIASKEVPVELVIAFSLEVLFVARSAENIAFRIIDPRTERPIFIILAITCSTVLIMCPAMSLAATLLYNGITTELFSHWLQKLVYNFPFAFFSQIFLIGPLVRFLFGLLFRQESPEAVAVSIQE